MHAVLRRLRDEHDALSALLRTLLQMLAQSRATHRPPDFGALRAMLFYVAEFPEKHHHRKESQFLFPCLRARTPMARAMLDRLDEDHARGEGRIRELEHALTAWELVGDARADAFQSVLQRYADFYREHMALEERTILPLAERYLTDEDWAHLDIEMRGEPDPLTGDLPDAAYRALFDRIVGLVPAPWGLAAPEN